MTVEAQNPDGTPVVKSGPYNGNGVTTVFNVDFLVLAESEVEVRRQNADLTEDVLELTTDYTVSSFGPGTEGSTQVTLVSAALLPTGTKLVITPSVAFNQATDYSNQGRIQLELLESSLDRITLMCRELREELQRAVTVDAFGTTDLSTLRTNIAALGLIEAEIATVAGAIGAVNTVAGIAAAVSTVAGIAAAVTTVAANAATVATVASNIADVNTVVANLTAIQNAAANAASAAASANAAALSAAAAATFDPANFVSKAGFITDAAASITTAAEGLSSATRLDTQVPTNSAVYALAEDGAWSDPISFWIETFFTGSTLPAGTYYTSTAIASGTLSAQSSPNIEDRIWPTVGVNIVFSASANSGYRIVGGQGAASAFTRGRFRARLTRSPNVTAYVAYAGYHNSTDQTAPTRGCYFEFSSGNLRAALKGTGAVAYGATTYAVATFDALLLQIDRDREANATRFRAWKMTRANSDSPVVKTLVMDDTITNETMDTAGNLAPCVVCTSPSTTAGASCLSIQSIGFGALAK